MELTRAFKNLSKNDAGLAGGKGASLGEMTQAGIPVPPGFVVLSNSFERFLEETDLNVEIDSMLHKVNHKEIHTVERASEDIKALILAAKMPKDIAEDIKKQFKELNTKYVAVRSSATAEDGADHAWAGQLDSYLNTPENKVLEKVQHCWASLFTPRAIFYRFEKGLHSTKISVAVVIQKMVESEVSGIAFSVHPVTEDHNQLIIEAGFGLGEAIVSGQITPDSYVVEKEPRNILDINVSTQERALYRSENHSKEHDNNEWVNIPEPKASSQVLTEAQILELSEIILKIENHYGFPCDIEWAFEVNKFYIVQSRPITTLSNNPIKKNKFKQIYKDIKDFDYVKRVSFYRVPLITIEIPQKTFVDNPLLKDLGLDFIFNAALIIQDETAEAWHYQSVKKINDVGIIERIISMTNEANKTNMDRMFDFLNSNSTDFEPLFLVDLIDYLNEKSLIVQRPHLFFNEDCFDVSDPVMLEKLQVARLSSSILVEPIGQAYEKIVKLVHLKTKISRDVLDFANNEEFKKIITGDVTKEDLKNIKNRPYAIIVYLNKYHCLYNDDVKTLISFLSNSEKDSTRNTEGEVLGQIAYKGNFKGKVVVLDAKDYRSAEKILLGKRDYVLVTPMTRPEIVTYIKNAGAFVTDEGGITCHAAIISRELKKPCIIGTKIATKVFKDGDMVEVDAEKGIVRIVK